MLELEISNVRGIPSLLLRPDANNFVVWGPNGSGKSAVVDAIDFLLTGRVSRLTGPGTGGITLSKHGPHIDHKPEEATVRAVVQLPGVTEPVEITRCMAHPGNLHSSKPSPPSLQPVMALARRGQHVLTRRDILKYITAEAGTRAEQIQELLNITEIEDIRKALVRVHNDLDGEREAAKRSVDIARAAVNATVQEQTYREDTVLRFANQSRAALGGQPISDLRSADLKSALAPPTVLSTDQAINVALLEKDIQNLRSLTSQQNQVRFGKNDERLRTLIADVRSDPMLLRALSRLKLTELGITLIDETGSCPLCDRPWPAGALREYLKKRLSTAQAAAQRQARIAELSDAIAGSVNNAIASTHKVIGAAQLAGLKDQLPPLQLWVTNLQALSSALSAAIDKYPDPRFGSDDVRRTLAPANLPELLESIHSLVKAKYPEATPEQTAWDTLTRLGENMKAVERAKDQLAAADLSYRRAAILLHSFQQARDSVLGTLYQHIRDRFVDLYRQLHGPDEDNFAARIEPEGAALNLEVDFYGRGTHPPHALHSEGHQDSMGLCLYLALAEQLTEGLIDLLILDDVVMSVDADHRRQVCQLLATSFPGRQFLITTHDKTWANQLNTEGVVSSGQTLEFYNWNIDTGPQVSCAVDMWERIEEDLQRNDVPAAAGRLRRGSEQFFGMACDLLQARIIYKLNGRWDLGDFLPAAMGRFRSLLKAAKKTAQSWDHKDQFDALQELDSTVGPIYTRSNAEQWAVNANVHYSNWANFSENDFRPVVAAFQDLSALFVCGVCGACGSMLRLVMVGMAPASVRCNCGAVDWNLVEKGKTT